jgi:hydrogenase-1 operon protein HyaF
MSDQGSAIKNGVTGIADSLMYEIAGHLARLDGTGESAAIDIRSLPMTAGDREILEKRLGRGEVTARLDVAGISEIWETRYAGVWWVRHLAADGRTAAETVEITPVPHLLTACPEDITVAAGALRRELSEEAEEHERAEARHV